VHDIINFRKVSIFLLRRSVSLYESLILSYISNVYIYIILRSCIIISLYSDLYMSQILQGCSRLKSMRRCAWILIPFYSRVCNGIQIFYIFSYILVKNMKHIFSFLYNKYFLNFQYLKFDLNSFVNRPFNSFNQWTISFFWRFQQASLRFQRIATN